MDKYIIEQIYSDGYERYAQIKNGNETSSKKKIGDAITGVLSISLITNSSICNSLFEYKQNIRNSSYIQAVADITEIGDEYTVYALTNITNTPILIEFENKIPYKVHDRIYIEGSLELTLTNAV